MSNTNILNCKVDKFSDFLKSYRISKGMTQKELSKKSGLWYREGRNVTHCVTEYEMGRKYPDVKAIYNLSKTLCINEDSMFNIVLGEMIRRYYIKASTLYSNFLNGKDCKFNFGFLSTKNKINLYYPKTANCFLETRRKNKMSRKGATNFVKQETGVLYSRNTLYYAEQGIKCSIPFIHHFFYSFGEDPSIVVDLLIKEKMTCYTYEFQKSWDEYKKNKNSC